GGKQAFPRADVVDGQDAEAPAADELIGYEVERPYLVGPGRCGQRSTCSQSPFATASFAHAKAFLAIHPKQPFVIHDKTLTLEQDVQPAIAEPAPFMSVRDHPLAQSRILHAA